MAIIVRVPTMSSYYQNCSQTFLWLLYSNQPRHSQPTRLSTSNNLFFQKVTHLSRQYSLTFGFRSCMHIRFTRTVNCQIVWL